MEGRRQSEESSRKVGDRRVAILEIKLFLLTVFVYQ